MAPGSPLSSTVTMCSSATFIARGNSDGSARHINCVACVRNICRLARLSLSRDSLSNIQRVLFFSSVFFHPTPQCVRNSPKLGRWLIYASKSVGQLHQARSKPCRAHNITIHCGIMIFHYYSFASCLPKLRLPIVRRAGRTGLISPSISATEPTRQSGVITICDSV